MDLLSGATGALGFGGGVGGGGGDSQSAQSTSTIGDITSGRDNRGGTVQLIGPQNVAFPGGQISAPNEINPLVGGETKTYIMLGIAGLGAILLVKLFR